MISKFGVFLFLCGAVLWISPGVAKEAVFVLDHTLKAWDVITFDNKKPNRFGICGVGCIEAETAASVSIISKPVSIDLAKYPVFSWEWKIDRPVAISDLTVKGKDDRSVAVYVAFPYDPDKANFSEKISRTMIEIFQGSDAPGRSISYVWGGYGNPADVVKSPYYGTVNAMIIGRNQSAPVGDWIIEKMDLVADHKRIYGYVPTTVSHVSISADSDDIGGQRRSFVRNIEFSAK